MLDAIINWLVDLAQRVNPTLFVLIGSFVEEVLAPIPSPLIMVTTAGLVRSLEIDLFGIIWLMVIAAVGKTIASYLVYVAADKAEDIVVGRFGKYVGLNHTSIERIGSLLNRGYWDDVVLFLLRALPIVPSIIISAAGGVLKINMRTYLTTTFFGTIVRNSIYFAIVYLGLGQAEAVWNFVQEKVELAVVGLIAICLLCWLAYRIKQKLTAKVLRHPDQPRV